MGEEREREGEREVEGEGRENMFCVSRERRNMTK